MAYDFGSQTLGIKNPFKTEGKFRVATGVLLAISGIIPLLNVASTLKEQPIYSYTYAILGFILLASGVRHTGIGIFQLFRYFVGRSVPTSLAYNYSRSEQDTAKAEKNALLYNDAKLHSMLMGRKNTTFAEPIGWISRLIHSLSPNLTFLPNPLRHLAQELGALTLNFLTAFVSFLVVFFVVSTGLAGETAKQVTMPVLSILLFFYLIMMWRSTANSITNQANKTSNASGGVSFGAVIALSIIVPVFMGFALDELTGWTSAQVQNFTETVPIFSAWGNFALLLVAILFVIIGVVPNLNTRLKAVTPQTEVSEYRDNMQESVHPNEIFINIENIVLANRRYKEIPNRIYREFDPALKEQAEGKGSFAGELLVETQPILADENKVNYKTANKVLSTALAQLSVLVAFAFFAYFTLNLADALVFLNAIDGDLSSSSAVTQFAGFINTGLFSLFGWLSFQATGKILNNASHLFWGEIHFTSLLMFLKTEGTYTESRISTGMAIHDSTRSENVVVRSSITPWIITSRLNTSIFATSGSGNLESSRYIMGMSKNNDELDTIVKEIKDFLKGRESIASITNEADLQNASTIHQVNQQSRFLPEDKSNEKLESKDDEAAGYLRNDADKDVKQ
ncbi:hypothetical protein [Aliiglaciecola sp. LCG003]|uniref:hypothetical protein n=1 Tax=Aliiglaciecola sp. LCG003 TaxID=3053655 RepID=UPI002572D20D|nr:hypothetical protein [Aliiglaciecola sp. LCG003]WJG08689.1 hypothetical protein QR722_15280 [Aliiglaciecola sp. LCG003]